MADASYIIELVLKARDDTAAAFESALGNQKQFNEEMRQGALGAQKQRAEWENMATSIKRSRSELGEAMSQLSHDSAEILTNQRAVEQAARRAAQAEASHTASIRDQLAAHNNLQAAQDRLYASLKKNQQEAQIAEAGLSEAYKQRGQIMARIEAIDRAGNLEKDKGLGKERERLASLIRQLEAVEKIDNKTRATLQLESQRLAQVTLATEKFRQQEQVLNRLENTAKKYVNAFDDRQAEKFNRELQAQAASLTRLGRSAGDVSKILDDVFDQRRIKQFESASNTAWNSLLRNAKSYKTEVDRLAKAEDELVKARRLGTESEGVRQMEADYAKARQSVERLAESIKNTIEHHEINIPVDMDIGGVTGKAAVVEALKVVMARDVNFDVDADVAGVLAKMAAVSTAKRGLDEAPTGRSGLRGFFDNISGSVSEMGERIQKSANSVSTFDNFLRGLLSLGVAVFFGQIIVLAGAAAGALTALAGSAVYAGGALGGALVAGIAQAIPALAVLGAAIQRVSAVMEAVKQNNLLQQQEYAKTGQAAKQTADATDQIKSAQDSLEQSTRRVGDAQKGLTEARQKARRELQDLILQEKEAELAAKGAALSQQEAQNALRQAIQRGDTGSIARARLGVQEAGVGVRQANLRQSRASQDLSVRQAQGVEGSPEVTAARRAIADAQTAQEQAERGLARARRSAAQTGTESLAAAGKLNFMLSQLSESERKLYEQFNTFTERFRRAAQRVTAPLIDSFAGAMVTINKLLVDPRAINAGRNLATALATQFTRVFDALRKSGLGKFLEEMSEEASRNLKPIGDIAIGLGRAFMGIARAASPALRELLGYFSDLATAFGDFANTRKGQKALQDFFGEGVKQFKAWMSLLGAVAKLFFTIIDPKQGGGATSGLKILQGITEEINKLQKAAASPEGRKFLQDFFETSIQALSALKPLIIAVAEAFASLFDENGVKSVNALVSIFTNILVPAFADFLHMIGLVTQAFGLIADNKVGAAFLRVAVSGSLLLGILTKLMTVFRPFYIVFQSIGAIAGPVSRVLLSLGGLLTRFGGIFTRVGALIIRAAPLIGRAITLMFGPWGIAVLAVVAVLAVLQQKFNIFGRALGALRSAFTSVRNAFRNTFNAIRDFVENNWEKILVALTGPLGLLTVTIIKHFDDIVDFFKELPGKLGNLASRAARAVVSAFENVGGDIMDAIMGGVNDAGSVAVNIANAIVKIIEDAWNGTIGGKGIGPLKVPKLDLPAFASGGAIDGPGTGTSDSIVARVSKGEHVWTAAEVARAGGHQVMYALRAFFGGGGQAKGSAYAEGGQVREAAASANIQVGFSGDLADFASSWKEMWSEVRRTARSGTNDVEGQIRDMRVNVTRTMDRLYKDFRGSWADIENSATVRSTRMSRSIRKSVSSAADAVYKGMSYIAKATNDSLKAFDADPVKVSVSAPDMGGGDRAATGFLGMQGERGRDAIPIWVGRGEAVLNWAHQKLIEPALNAYYGTGLQGLFARTSGYHAGGQGDVMPGGYAKGGMAGPAGSGAAFNSIASFAMKKFGLTMTAGRTNHGRMTTSGNVSDHSWGGAGDFANATQTTDPAKTKFYNFWKSKLPQVIKQMIYQHNSVGQGGGVVPYLPNDHFNHVHLAIQRSLYMDNNRMAKLISRASRNLNINDLLNGVTDESGAVTADHVDRVKVGGKRGPIRTMIQKMLDKVRSAANQFIDLKSGANAMAGTGPNDADRVVDGGIGRARTLKIIAEAMRILSIPRQIRSGWSAMAIARAQQESGFDPNAINLWDSNAKAGHPSQGLFQTIPSTFNAYKLKGHNNLLDPLDNTLAAFRYMRARYGRGDWGQALAVMRGIRGGYARGGFPGGAPGFARGGFIGGGLMPRMGRAATSVLQVGDSLGVGTEDLLKKLIDGISTNSRVGRTSQQGLEILRNSMRDSISKVIFDLGTNDGTAQQLAKSIKAALRVVGEERELVIPTVEGPQAAAKNRVIRQLASQHSNITVPDWAGNDRGLLAPDGIHATPQGYKERAQLLAKAVGDAVRSAVGAAPGSDRERRRSIARSGRYTAPDLLPTDFEGIMQEFGLAFQEVVKRSRSLKKIVSVSKVVTKNLGALTDENGIIDQATTALQNFVDDLSTSLGEMTYSLSRSGIVNMILSPTEQADRQIANMQAAINKFIDLDADIDAALEEVTDRLNAVNREIARLERRSRRRGLTGDERDELKDLRESRDNLTASQTNLQRRARESQQAVNDKMAELFQAQLDRFTKATEDSLANVTAGGQNLAQNDIATRIASAFGRGTGALDATRVEILRRQQDALRGAIAEADRRGYADLAAQYRTQFDELSATIAEGVASQLNNAIQAAQAEFQRRIGVNDLQGRIADLAGRGARSVGGGAVGAAQLRLGASQSRQQILSDRLLEASREADAAFWTGNQGALNTLTDEMNELTVQLAENAQNIADNTVAITQARIDQITQRGQFQTGIFGQVGQILAAVGASTGTDTSGAQLGFANRTTGALQSTIGNLAWELLQSFGIDLRNQNGGQIAQTLGGLNFDAIEFNMSEAQRTTFEGLISAILDNVNALQQNSDAIDELTGKNNDQGFSSTAWQWFRNAIFTGNGTLLPQYASPSAGLSAASSPMMANSFAGTPAGGQYNIGVHVTEQVQDADPETIAQRTAWVLRNRR